MNRTELEAEIKHTETPWKAVRLAGQAYGTIDWEIVSPRNTDQPNYNLHEKRIATLQTDDEETKANARFICKAVNCHEELVEALEAYVSMHADKAAVMPERNENEGKQWGRIMAMAKQALAKAKGEA